MTTRRGFLTGMLALGAAPAIVRAESLMKLWVPPQHIVSANRYIAMTGSVGGNPIISTHLADKYIAFVHPAFEEAIRDLMRDGGVTVKYIREVVRHG